MPKNKKTKKNYKNPFQKRAFLCYNLGVKLVARQFMKILSPAGNFESLKMAVYNGADEVYLGISDFNARNNIEGFSLDTLGDAVNFAHVYNVKVHLAINILFDNSELECALEVVGKALNLGVDAFIVQDLGLISLINKLYPMADVHLSTQMGIHNLEGVLALKKYKFSRVVLARETPLEEIKRIKKLADIEIEYFAQGALCVSFSGNCYLSSYEQSASGNRGKCKQLCRLPYTFYKGDKKLKKGYLLSAKDFCMIDRLKDLSDAGVDAIKIEGRARRPFYVATATREYRKALDGIGASKENLKLAFNRDYTEGYFNGNGEIISNVQSHIGLEVGRVFDFKSGKKFNEVFFTSNREIYPKSTLKFLINDSQTTISAFDVKSLGDNRFVLTTTSTVKKGASVHLIVDSDSENRALSFVKKRHVDIEIFAKIGEQIRAEFELLGQKHLVYGQVLDSAKSKPLAKEELKNNFSKSEYFVGNIKIGKLENVFILKQNLNAFRRKVFDKVFEILTAPKHSVELQKLPKLPKINAFSDFVIVEKISDDFSAKNVIYSPSEYVESEILAFKNKCVELGAKPYLDTPNFALKRDIKLLKTIVKNCQIGIVANNYYALDFDTEIVVGAGLNVYNNFTASELAKEFFTAESDLAERVNFAYMTLRHCPIKNLIGGSCDKCIYADDFSYKLESGKVMRLKRKKLSTCTFYLTD